MRKRCTVCLMLLSSLLVGGCTLNPLTDISGWDLSACWSGFGTCYELFTDNQQRILGGQTAIGAILGADAQR